jgi:hypothetical protein
MFALRSFSLVPCVLLMTAGVALSQTRQAAPPPDGAYMTGFTGLSVSDQIAPVFGIEIGEHVSPRVQAYATFTYFDNLFNDDARRDLDLLETQLSAVTGATWEFEGRDRGLAFSGGAKYLLSDEGNVRPYIGGGPGVLNLRRSITERDLGEMSDAILAVFGAPDGAIDPTQESTFKPMVEGIVGVGVTKGRAYFDVGYRFRKVFRSRESFIFHQVAVAVGMGF